MGLDIATLASEASFWEIAGYCSAGIVTLGVAGEAVTELTDWTKPGPFKKAVERASVHILLLGLAAEILTQVQANGKNSLIIGLLDQQTAQLKSDNLVLEAKIAPRRLSDDDIAKLKTAVAPFLRRQISVWSYGVDVEGRVLASQILSALNDAHAQTVDSIGHMVSSTTLRTGVIITGPDDELIAALLVALKPLSPTRGSLNNPGAFSKSGVDMLYGLPSAVPAEIFVGVKPFAP